MSKQHDGGSAFPNYLPWIGGDGAVRGGMSLRDYFATQALIGVINHPHVTDGSPEQMVDVAYRIADAMLAERAK